MVKGIVKYAVVLQNTENCDFEQAIFISDGPPEALRVDSASELLQTASRLAAKGGGSKSPRGFVLPAVCFFAGAGLTAFVCLITAFM